jgi:translation initiation factor 3 subunit I
MKPLVLKGHSMPITVLEFNRDNDLLFSASKDRYITLWSSEYGERIGTYAHSAAVYAMNIDDNSKYVISSDSTGFVYIWDASNGESIHKFSIDKLPLINSVNFSYNNELISVGYGGRSAKSESHIDIYKFSDLLTKQKNVKPIKSILIPNNDKITKTKWFDLGKSILATSETGNLYKYDYESGRLVLQKQVHDKIIMDIDVSPKEELIITSSKDGKAKILNPETFDIMTELFPQNPVRNINACRFNPLISSEDEKVVKYHAFIAGGQESREVTTTASKKGGFETIIYDCMYGEELGAILGHFGPVNALAVSSDGELLASGSEESSIRVHRMNNDEYNNLERK